MHPSTLPKLPMGINFFDAIHHSENCQKNCIINNVHCKTNKYVLKNQDVMRMHLMTCCSIDVMIEVLHKWWGDSQHTSEVIFHKILCKDFGKRWFKTYSVCMRFVSWARVAQQNKILYMYSLPQQSLLEYNYNSKGCSYTLSCRGSCWSKGCSCCDWPSCCGVPDRVLSCRGESWDISSCSTWTAKLFVFSRKKYIDYPNRAWCIYID